MFWPGHWCSVLWKQMDEKVRSMHLEGGMVQREVVEAPQIMFAHLV